MIHKIHSKYQPSPREKNNAHPSPPTTQKNQKPRPLLPSKTNSSSPNHCVTAAAEITDERLSTNARGHSPSGKMQIEGAATNHCHATALR